MVGLGNPGAEFEGTRHNVGAEVVELLTKRHGGRLKLDRRCHALVAEVRIGRGCQPDRKLSDSGAATTSLSRKSADLASGEDGPVILAVPQTYMNESGMAVKPLVRRYSIADLARLVVVHDELDLPPGTVRVKCGGGLAGHKGLESIRSHLHDASFTRVRIGIGKPPGRQSGVDYVLRKLGRVERETIGTAVEYAADAVEAILVQGAPAAMNTYNG